VPECCAAEEGWGGVQVSLSSRWEYRRSKEWKVPRDDEIFSCSSVIVYTELLLLSCHLRLRAVPPSYEEDNKQANQFAVKTTVTKFHYVMLLS